LQEAHLVVIHFGNVTFERKIVVGLEEIRAITFECHKCKSRLTVSPDDIRDIPIACPHCNFSWRLPEDPSAVPSGSLPKAFAFGIRELKIRFGADVIGFKILLEFDEPGRHAL
jgi:DNA-directed RNA polymerase subunit RPC12/RpoP